MSLKKKPNQKSSKNDHNLLHECLNIENFGHLNKQSLSKHNVKIETCY